MRFGFDRDKFQRNTDQAKRWWEVARRKQRRTDGTSRGDDRYGTGPGDDGGRTNER